MKLVILFGSINAWKVNVKANAFSPNVIHDNCDVTIFGSDYVCELSQSETEPHLECFEDCGVNMYTCDCNIYTDLFTWYDNTVCKWKAVRNSHCSLNSATTTTTKQFTTTTTTTTTELTTTTTTSVQEFTSSMTTKSSLSPSVTPSVIPIVTPSVTTSTTPIVTTSVTTIETSSVTPNDTPSTTASVTSTSNYDPESKVYEMEISEIEKIEEQRVEHASRSTLTYSEINSPGPTRCDDVISANWNCSSGMRHHSVCIRQCSTDYLNSESIKCKCKNSLCRWEQKGRACPGPKVLNQDSMRADVPFSSQGPLSRPQTSYEENIQSHVINVTPDGPQTQREIPVGTTENSITELGQSGQFGQIPDETESFPQFLRDINLSNMGQMIFNVNYFNNYASTL